MPNDPFAQSPLMVQCTLSNGNYKNQLNALIDTGATGYAFIDELTAHTICEQLLLTPIPLSKPKPIRGFDGRIVEPITHAIYPHLTVQDHHELTAPLLITTLGQHPIILGKPWLNRHRVLLDMESDSLVFGRCDHAGAATPNKTTPTQVTAAPKKILLEPPVKAPEPPTNSKWSKDQIGKIGAVAFKKAAREKDARLFSITLNTSDPVTEVTELALADSTKEIPELPPDYRDFADVFDRSAADQLPPHRTYDHKIEITENASLPRSRLYPMSQFKLEKVKEYLQENLEKGFITPSQASCGSPILFVAKKNGDLRFCVDYRKLNAITKKDRYPLPLIDETLARIAGCKFITKFDIVAAFNKLRMHPDSEELTTFVTSMGAYKYRVMPFGLTNGPASYQHYMNDTLLPYLNDFAQAYIDDIIIYSKTRKEHIAHVRKVLQKLREAGLQVDIEKSEFFVQETHFLGLIVSTEGLKMDPKKIETVVKWPAPTNLREVQSFIGFCNFYRRFIRDFSRIARPLTRLAQKDVPFEWTEACQTAFNELKTAVTSAPVLRHFDRDRPAILETDSSDYINGGVLSQKDDSGVLHPVAFYSKNLLPAECNYEIYDKELLAIIQAFEQWRPELEYTEIPIQVFTDHKSLQHFMTTKVLTRRQARWAEKLSEFNFKIIPRPGTKNGKADALTRMPGTVPAGAEDIRRKFQERVLLPPDTFQLACTAEDEPQQLFERVRLANITDQECSNIRQAKLEGKEKFHGISLRHCSERDGALYFWDNLWVPQVDALLLEVVREAHLPLSSGHKGITKTVHLIKRYYFWPGMRSTVRQFIQNCYDCQRAKVPKDRQNGLLQPLPIPQQRWTDISMDFILGLPKTKNGSNAILNVIDRLSKQRHYIPCSTDNEGTSAENTVKMLIQGVYRLHGAPASIVCDRGPQFISAIWKSFCRRLRIQTNLSTAFHPQTDGQTERANQDVETFLRLYTNENQDDWDELLPMAEFADNNAVANATKLTPFFLNHGFHPRMSIGPDPTNYETTRERLQSQTAADIAQRMNGVLTYARANAEKAQRRMTEQANKHRKDVDYKPGDMVFLSSKNIRSSRPSKKLDDKNLGPFSTKEKVGHAFRLNLPSTMKIHDAFHPVLLRKAATDPLPGQEHTEPPPIIIEDEEWEVDDILNSRLYGRWKRLQYQVKWKGYDKDITWYNANGNEFRNCQDIVNDFHSRNPTKPGGGKE
jgi:hypothetical protein